MKKVCVITGGGSGMGLATANLIGNEYFIILVGRTAAKLDNAVKELTEKGFDVTAFSCDVSNEKSVRELAEFAKSCGDVKAVIHSAGLSPNMGDGLKVMEVNAIGTINVANAFYDVMISGGCLLNVSSMSAYLTPQLIMPKRKYNLCRVDKDLFLKKMMSRVNLFPKDTRSGVAYGISKNFVNWFSKTEAARFGKKGIRVVSVTPGNFDTPMGDTEKDEAEKFIKFNAIKRIGDPYEIAFLFANVIDERNGYLTGTDIICDGGCIASGANPLKK